MIIKTYIFTGAIILFPLVSRGYCNNDEIDTLNRIHQERLNEAHMIGSYCMRNFINDYLNCVYQISMEANERYFNRVQHLPISNQCKKFFFENQKPTKPIPEIDWPF